MARIMYGTGIVLLAAFHLLMTFCTQTRASDDISGPLLNPSALSIHSTSTCNTFNPILAFGDSTTDTGNAVLLSLQSYQVSMVAPYGNTFFGVPTGRCSDGRLMVDFFCTTMNVSFLLPHLTHGDSTSQNFAIAGATSLNSAMLEQLSGVMSSTLFSIADQLDWFTHDVFGMDLTNALVYFGEIGGNDYNCALEAEQAPEQVAAALVTPVIQQIATSLDTLLSYGVRKLVTQGEFPMGCMVLYLKMLSDMDRDEHGCIAAVSAISDQHNRLLRDVISKASEKYPDAEIVFFDTSAAYLHISDNATEYGFANTQDACYPKLLSPPGQSTEDIPLCPNPENYIGWDGMHLTDAMYGALMNLFLSSAQFASPYPNFLFRPQCDRISHAGKDLFSLG